MQSLANLVSHVVDYAGLFPPASLPLDEVIANFSDYCRLPSNKMLGRLVLPAGRIEEFATLFDNHRNAFSCEFAWKISALLPPVLENEKFSNACQAIGRFNDKYQDQELVIDSLEIKTDSPENVSDTIDRLPPGIQAFLEIDPQTDPQPSIQAIANHAGDSHAFAKIRTGSVVADQIPAVKQVAQFICACATDSVGFKATAGLHHPLRNEYRLTYEENPPRGIMHGFLNVFVAAMVAFDKRVEQGVIEEILSETEPASFKFEEQLLRWRDFEVTSPRIKEIRKQGIISFGSCSFLEPTEELQALGYQHLFAPA